MSALANKGKGSWNIAKGKLKQTLARLMQDDVRFIEGKTDELVGRIQKRAAGYRKRIERNRDILDEPTSDHL